MPVEHITSATEASHELSGCAAFQRIEVERHLEIENALTARGTGLLRYETDDPHPVYQHTDEFEIEELDLSLEMATVENFEARGTMANRDSYAPTVQISGRLVLADGAVLAALNWDCGGCSRISRLCRRVTTPRGEQVARVHCASGAPAAVRPGQCGRPLGGPLPRSAAASRAPASVARSLMSRTINGSGNTRLGGR